MISNKASYFKILAVVGILFAVCFIAIINGLDQLGNVLSPIGAGTAGGITLYSYIKCDRSAPVRIVLLLYISAFLSWMAGDILWAVAYGQDGGPNQNVLINSIYFLTNIFLFTAFFIYMLLQYKKWSLYQALLDILASCFLILMTVWIVVFQKSDRWMEFFAQQGFLSGVSIVLDFLMLIGCFILIFSNPKINRPFVKVILFALLGFAINDLFYYILYANQNYLPVLVNDALYIAMFLILAMGVLWNVLFKTQTTKTERPGYTGSGIRWYYFLVLPVLSVIFEGFVLDDLIIFLMAVTIYETASKHIHLSIKNEEMLRREKEINTTLENRLQAQLKELTVLANQDTVTNLYNRRFFMNALETAIKDLPDGRMLSMLLMDIDRFKNINDNFGHDVGDKVLIAISERLVAWNRGDAVIARLGGDEFAILLKNVTTNEELENSCKKIIDVCRAPIQVDERTLYITISMGLSIYPLDGQDSIVLLKNADISLYRAKAQGYNRFVFFNSFFQETLIRKREIESLLRQAIMDRDCELYYQPQFSLPDKKLIGAEALLRWESMEYGFIPPNEFIPVAEEIDFINRIGNWVLMEAVNQIVKWNKTYGLELKVGINISPKQLSSDDFLLALAHLINKNNVNADWIDAEITENIMLEEQEMIKNIFGKISNLGVSISIDDFGSGYSSWGYLTKFPFDRIKIDKTLIDNISYSNSSGIQVVKAIIAMAKAIGKTTIAEGVEKTEQLDILNSLHCEQIQGYLTGRPVPATVFEELFISSAKDFPMFPQESRNNKRKKQF